ncbi:hypothetical protein K402DRAFT_227855 [Aulographum hederae CBS 113979]|uniref:Myb-like domain-containing protein n=1 Tax=Aulographum hederae CBS 113979 TaxID=1176131 RepID=A0A6G1HBD3_9PEZI|nr:hypothetical protein K402DRAFT_227855 [Aulographum hederae CBS 113979]
MLASPVPFRQRSTTLPVLSLTTPVNRQERCHSFTMTTAPDYQNIQAHQSPYPPQDAFNYGVMVTGSYDATPSEQFHTPQMVSSQLGTPQMGYQTEYLTPRTTSMDDYQPKFEPVDFTHEFKYPQGPEVSSGLNISGVSVSPYDFLPIRPHSSPSTFGPLPDDIIWTGLPQRTSTDLSYTTTHEQPFPPLYSPIPAPAEQRHRPSSSTGSFTDIKNPQPRRSYPPIAPNPAGLAKVAGTKRSMDDEDYADNQLKRRRKFSSPVPASPELSEEDRLLLKLKDEENMPWKDIATRFQTDLGKVYQVPALQMRLKRLRERLRVWTDTDLSALRMAHDYWERSKFEIISAKMMEFGAMEKWSPRQCARKWQELNVGTEVYAGQVMHTPAFSWTSSPVEGPTPSFMPFLHVPATSA